MKKRLFEALLITGVIMGTMVGCSNKAADTSAEKSADKGSQSSEAQGDADGSVYWMNMKPESDEVLQQVAKMYTDETGVPVKVVTAASGTYGQQMRAEMDKSDPPTMFVIGNANAIKEWKDYALDLTGTPIVDELNTDAYNVYDESGKLISVGYCYECYGIIVNPDLVKAAGHSMDEIKNFETLKTVVEDIHARADELGFDAFTSCDMDPSSSWRFSGHLANLEYYYEQEGKTWTTTPASLSGKYMENFKNLYDLCINNSLTASTDLATGGHDPSNEFKTGKAAFQIQGSWEYDGLKDDVPNASMIPYYCGVEGEENAGLNCGTENCWAINATVSKEDQQATMDFMVWCVTDPEASRLLVDSFGIMPYKQAAKTSNAFLADAAKYEEKGCYVMNWANNFQPNLEDYRASLVAAFNQYNADQNDANWEMVRTAFIDGWAVQYQAENN